MQPLTENELRASFINASRKEVSDLSLPPNFDSLDWGRLDYLGWRDTKFDNRAYAVVPGLDGDTVTGIMFRHPGSRPGKRAQCAWCQDITLNSDVVLYAAKRSGKAGRNGDTVGTLLCEDFECSRNVRKPLTAWYEGFDVDAARQEQIDGLHLRMSAFAAEL
ncbi:FBP domain-containing protein [Demequina sp. B12]|uniref:FBP domain-containing protein n=1 Tax=Demequina sp. B12 TaxID=2992757 RepID=UPI00237BA37C|nr:FBP domain-containing protein [Demequina sp. B12]MDE0573289.1 FBP domain-containing protein [Demequina sp. B12]